MPSPSPRRWNIVHSEASPGWGGQERRVLIELREFRKRGSQVRLIADTKSEIYKRSVDEGFEAFPCSPLRRWYVREFIRVRRWLKEIKPDIVNTHSSRDGWVVGMAAKAAGVPLIIRSRHIDVAYRATPLNRFLLNRLTDHLVTTSTAITRDLTESFGFGPGRVSTIPTGVDTALYRPDGPRTDLVPNPEGLPVVGMISILRSWKGHDTFLAAARLRQDRGTRSLYLIVGEGGMRPKIAEQIASLSLGGLVTMAGDRNDVPEVLRGLSLLAIPSTKHEGVPQVGLQAMATRVPVIGSDVGGIPDIVVHGETGRIFQAGNAAAMAECMDAALSETDRTREMTDRAFHRTIRNHDLSAMADALEAIYHRCLDHTGMRAGTTR